MSESSSTVLDHVEHLEVPGRPFDAPANEYWALLCLWRGLEQICSQVANVEAAVRARINPDGKSKWFILGGHPAFSDVPMDLLSCWFQWYAVSACQYVRTVGTIRLSLDPSATKPPAYVEAVIPDVLAFRNKVAAHFAWTTRNERDNDAERAVSVLPQITWLHNEFVASGITLSMSSEEGGSDSRKLKPWSVTLVHAELRKRYWPELVGPWYFPSN